MTPIATSTVVPVSLGSSAETGILSSPGVPPLTPPNQLAGSTDQVILPVVPEASTPPYEPVNPVNTGNLAGLPQSDAIGSTDGIIPKTYKLPSSVLQSMQAAVDRLNEVTPGTTMHSYGVNLLSRHEEWSRLEQDAAFYKFKYEQLLEGYDALSEAYRANQGDLDKAESEVTRLRREIASLRGTPPPAALPNSVVPPADDTWRIRYQELQTELKTAQESLELEKDSARPLYQFFKDVLPAALELLCQEAAAQSWKKPEYYQQYFQEIIAPYLETK